jgi:hypothetical protein
MLLRLSLACREGAAVQSHTVIHFSGNPTYRELRRVGTTLTPITEAILKVAGSKPYSLTGR